MAKIIVYQDGTEPYKNEFSNTNKKNIVWGVLQDSCLSTDKNKRPIYYSPHFLHEKAADFIGKNLVLNHNDDCVVGRGVDVVFNNNGIVCANGEILPADSRLWYCAEVDEEALKKYGVGIDELTKKCAFSTSFTNAEFASIGDSVNGFDFAENVQLVEKADVANMSLLYNREPRFNACQELHNSKDFDDEKNNLSSSLDLNCEAKNQKNVNNMADEVKENKIDDALLEAIKKVVEESIDKKFAEKEQALKNDECEKEEVKNENTEEKKEDLKNDNDEVVAKLDEILAILKAPKEEEKKEVANSDEEAQSNDEARNLTNSLESSNNKNNDFLTNEF